MTDFKKITAAIQYGEEAEAEAAIKSLVKAQDEESDPQRAWRKRQDQGLREVQEKREKMMVLLAGKHRMSEARSGAQQGTENGIKEFFLYRYPRISLDQDLFEETARRADILARQGHPLNEWSTYEQAASDVLSEHGIPDVLLEDDIIRVEEARFQVGESPKVVELPPISKPSGAGVEEVWLRSSGIKELAASRMSSRG